MKIRKGFWEKNRKAAVLLAVFLLLGAAVTVSEYREKKQAVREGITRSQTGGETKEEVLFYRVDGGKEHEVKVSVGAKALSEKEAKQLLTKAEKDWEEVYLGENASQQEISSDLNLPESLEGGKVSVTYHFNNHEAIDEKGNLDTEKIPEEGLLIQMAAEFSCGSENLEEIRSLRLVQPVLSEEEKEEKEVADLVADTESSSRGQTVFRLPDSVDGHSISWRMKRSYEGIFIIVLGFAAVAAFRVRDRENARSEKKKKNKQLLLEYPQMLEQISLLLGSGMTILAAWEKMVRGSYRRENSGETERLYLQEMRITYHEIRDGRSERECYERFGRRIGLEPYRRFSMILNQNLSKGTRDICALLETEAREAMEMRKNNAKRLGEEASSKLLGPMMLMFLIILLVVLVPAAANFSV